MCSIQPMPSILVLKQFMCTLLDSTLTSHSFISTLKIHSFISTLNNSCVPYSIVPYRCVLYIRCVLYMKHSTYAEYPRLETIHTCIQMNVQHSTHAEYQYMHIGERAGFNLRRVSSSGYGQSLRRAHLIHSALCGVWGGPSGLRVRDQTTARLRPVYN